MFSERDARECLLRLYETRQDMERISPAWMATEAMTMHEPENLCSEATYFMAHGYWRQIARSVCRQKAAPDDENAEQHEMFPDLQKRYPATHKANEEPEYVLLEYLNEDDVTYNVKRLRSEGTAKLRHADALEAWWQNRFAA